MPPLSGLKCVSCPGKISPSLSNLHPATSLGCKINKKCKKKCDPSLYKQGLVSLGHSRIILFRLNNPVSVTRGPSNRDWIIQSIFCYVTKKPRQATQDNPITVLCKQ